MKRSSSLAKRAREREKMYRLLAVDRQRGSATFTYKGPKGDTGSYIVRRKGPRPFDLVVTSFPGRLLPLVDERALRDLAYRELSNHTLPLLEAAQGA